MSGAKNKPDWITAICTIVITLTGIGALVYAHFQLKQIHEEAQVERLLKEVDKWDQEPVVSYRKLCAQQKLQGVSDPYSEDQVLNFFETMGELVDEGYLNEQGVWENFSDDIEHIYSDAHVMIEKEQREDDPTVYLHFVSLARRMLAIDKKKGLDDSLYDEGAIEQYWQQESQVIAGVPTIHRRSKAKNK
jgi:hypothetical protein